MSVEALVADLNAQKDRYFEAFARAHTAITENLTKAASTPGASGSSESAPQRQTLDLPQSLPASPTLSTPVPTLSVGPVPALSRRPSNVGGQRPNFDHHGFSTSSHFSNHLDASTLTDDSDTDEDESYYVQEHLPPQSFDHEHLRDHLKSYKFDQYGRQILANVFNDRGRLRNPSLFPEDGDLAEDKKNYSHYQVFDVGLDGIPNPVASSNDFDQNVSRSRQIWLAIRDINADAEKDHAVGRITYVYIETHPSRLR